MRADFISVIIPSYNEGLRIQPNLARVVDYLRSRFTRFEVIVVDDGSTDDAPKKVAEAAHNETCIKLIPFSTKIGRAHV